MSINMRVIPKGNKPEAGTSAKMGDMSNTFALHCNDQYEADTSTTMGGKYEVGTSAKMAIVMRLKPMPPRGDIRPILPT